MKLTVAWAKVISENSILKGVVISLTALVLFLGVTSLKLALRDPLVIERACFSKVADVVETKRTNVEIEAFLKEAIAQRFDSVAQGSNYLSTEERNVRDREQRDLQSRKLAQKVFVNSAAMNGNKITLEADRLISVGDIRSAFRFPLEVKIESVTRSASNPYGLILSTVKAMEKGEK